MPHSIRSSIVLSLALAGALFVAAGPSAAKDKSAPAPEWFQYVANFTCGSNAGQALRVVRGEYATAVNLYNEGDADTLIHKHIALVYPPAAQAAGAVSAPIEDLLAAGTALQVDCEEIGSEFLFPTPHAVTDHLQGFLVIESRLPLHVEAVYTAAGADGGASIDVVRVAERRVIPRPFEPPTGVTICHYPPGNPGNAHTIVVDVASLPAHKAHGDTLGACPNP